MPIFQFGLVGFTGKTKARKTKADASMLKAGLLVCEQQLNMGQSVLRDRKTPFWPRGVFHFYSKELTRQLSKGNRVNIPEPGHGDLSPGKMCGNANEVGDVGGSPWKSFLFFVRSPIPGICLPGDRDIGSIKHRGSCDVWCVLVGPWKSQEDSVNFVPGRTHIRSRSPRCTASSR